MGIYTDVAKVKSLFRSIKIEDDTGTEATNTVITTEEVTAFIDEVETLIKSRLSTCYDMATVGTESVKIIGMIAKFKVAQIIKDIMELTTSNTENTVQMVTSNWSKKADKMLDQICPIDECGKCKTRPSTPLPDTVMLTYAPATANRVAGTTGTPTFKRGQDNW